MTLKKNPKPHCIGHRDKLRKRFFGFGFDALADYEILELILAYIIPRKNVRLQAKVLIQEFGSLKQVLDVDLSSLKKMENLSDYSAGFLLFLRKFSSLYISLDIKQQKQINSPEKVKDFLISSLSGEKIEKFYVLTLDSGNRVMSYKELESGTAKSSFYNNSS